MDISKTAIDDVIVIKTKKFGDHRGFFSETYNKKALAERGVALDFVQDNHSLSADVGTIRGLHFQAAPFAQDKLVRVVKGRIFDVAVDLRRSSPTFGKHVAVEVSAEDWNQILVPIGFAHGFMTMEPNTEVIYKVTNFYAPDHDFGLAWDDPALGVEWPLRGAAPTLSDKDKKQPTLQQLIELGRTFP